MKVALALPRPLFPTDTGGKIRTLNIMTRLSSEVEIHAVSFAERGVDDAAIAEMQRVFASYTPVYWREAPKFSPRFYSDFARSRLSRFPYFLYKYVRPEFRRTVEAVAQEKGTDILLCDFLHPAAAMLESHLRPRVVFEHNVEYVIRQRHWEVEANPLRKAVLKAEWQKAHAAERHVCRAFDHILTVSEDDTRKIQEEFGAARVSMLPTGVDTDYFRPLDVPTVPASLVFVGSMDWHPNEDGVLWFVKQVLPLVRQRVPHATFAIVGRNPSHRLGGAVSAEDGVQITGRVDDVRPYIARAEVVVVPLRIGGGTRIKIFEAMAMAKPVVATALGAEGLAVTPDREIVIADEPRDMARRICELLGSAEQRGALGFNAHKLVLERHTWQAAARQMEEVLADCIARTGGSVEQYEAARA